MTDPEARLRAEGLTSASWSNGPFEQYAAHAHGYDKVLVCLSGSIRFGLPDAGRFVDLGPGDRLDLPAPTRHDAVVGPAGVTCLEGRLPAGALEAIRERPRGTW